MTRELTGPAPTRTRRQWPTLNRRARIVTANPVRTELVTTNLAQLRALHDNPNAEIVRLIHLEVDHANPDAAVARALVRYTDHNTSTLTTGTPAVRLTLNPHSVNTARQVGTALAWVLAVTSAATVTGGLIWDLFGDQITAVVKILALAGGGALALIALLWLLSAKAGICPGLHCPGCPHH